MDIQKYMGLNIAEAVDNPDKKELYIHIWNQLRVNYNDNVDWEMMRKQILLCEETKDYLYQKPGPVKYIKGTRPYLEKIVYDVTKDCKTDRERVLNLLVFCRDLYKRHETGKCEILFYGGTEEELIKKGENLCECMGRLMVSLCEIIGLPGRVVFHFVDGHIVCEIYFEDKWAYFDPRAGLFYLDENDKFLSVYEIMADRSVIKKQKDWVKEYVTDFWTYEYRTECNYNILMHPNAMQCFADYSLMDADEYHYEWKYCHIAIKEGLNEMSVKCDEISARILNS